MIKCQLINAFSLACFRRNSANFASIFQLPNAINDFSMIIRIHRHFRADTSAQDEFFLCSICDKLILSLNFQNNCPVPIVL
jgi:hypothetical protein